MNHGHKSFDSTPLAKDDPRYLQRLNTQHRLAFAPGLLVGGLVAGLFLGLPFAAGVAGLPPSASTGGWLPVAFLSAGIMSVVLLLGLGLIGLAMIQGAWRLVPAFWRLQTSLEELGSDQRFSWMLVEAGLGAVGFAAGFALAFLLL